MKLFATENFATYDGWNMRHTWFLTLSVLALSLLFFARSTLANNQQQTSQPPGSLKKLSLEELMNVEVTSVSKRPEKLSETASAIQVITAEDIRRSGAVTLAQALRLASNLQVAQVNAHDWAITARGFNGAPLSNNSLANKLLVMIDGRSIYTPLFGGVFWDVQNVVLEDIERIEVISGPGGTLWGANAVNGVINIVTKNTKDTQGVYASGAGGSFFQDLGVVRYGDQINPNLSFRVYAQRIDHYSTKLINETDARDRWEMSQGGFRFDYAASDANQVTWQGDVYGGFEGSPTSTKVDGQNVLGRWQHVYSDQSDFSLQIYVDRTWRNLPGARFTEDLQTYDFDFQHRVPLGHQQSLLWGAGYRLMRDRVHNSVSASFFPSQRDMQLFSGFVQDEIALVPDRLKLTVGTKLEHNDFSGFEFQPSVRMAWTPTERHTIWGAVSRAVHSPSRFDADIRTPFIVGNAHFNSEKVLAYELGYRVRPMEKVSVSLAGYYNRYDDLRSVNLNPKPPPVFAFANGQQAETWGFEASGTVRATNWWRVRGGYTYFGKDFRTTLAGVVSGSDTFEGIDPHNQFLFQSILDLPRYFQFDVVGRYVDPLPVTTITRRVPAYFGLDVRLAWQYKSWELSAVGQDLAEHRHAEFGSLQIPRSVYGKISWRF